MMTLLTEPMQVDYRSVCTSSGIIGEQNTWHTSGEWKWQLPLQYFTLSLAASINQLFDSLFQNSFLLLNLVFLLSGITQIFASSFHLCDYLGHLLTSFSNVVFDYRLYSSSLLELILNYGILLNVLTCKSGI